MATPSPWPGWSVPLVSEWWEPQLSPASTPSAVHPTRLTQCQNHSETNNIATADKIILALLPIFIRHLLLAVDIIVIVLYIFVSWSILIPVFPLEAFITEIALLHVLQETGLKSVCLSFIVEFNITGDRSVVSLASCICHKYPYHSALVSYLYSRIIFLFKCLCHSVLLSVRHRIFRSVSLFVCHCNINSLLLLVTAPCPTYTFSFFSPFRGSSHWRPTHLLEWRFQVDVLVPDISDSTSRTWPTETSQTHLFWTCLLNGGSLSSVRSSGKVPRVSLAWDHINNAGDRSEQYIYIKRNKNIKNLFCVGMSIMNISLDCPPPWAIKGERRNALRGSARGKECFDHQFRPQFRVYWGFRHSCRLHSPTVWMKYCWRNGFLYALLVCDSFTTLKDWEWIILGNKSSWSYCGEQCTGLGSCEGKDS